MRIVKNFWALLEVIRYLFWSFVNRNHQSLDDIDEIGKYNTTS